ncbi:thiamine pyrophosphate-binding protein [Ovoidimarina sediminis]|uniref:thiamine pyrophosphate-binding protein n=1 Tax=Ovoidimarina sediminis TaxID=3079856 RepID=UPI00290FF6EF|nr:thiamine pyrophosphate-binding protein [Rhodophyticola sp. MJ-SS7]MDU8942080.1 thiamine pyrophosphate-binding protein [Rhodophyticola sp. MJ-SS7]
MTSAENSSGHAGRLLVRCLAAQGIGRVYCIPGESYLAALDGLVGSGIDVIIARHEGAAAMMAEAEGKLTGAPGIAFVTRGPGATNAAAGIHVAFQDSTPMILFVGQVASDQRDREAFQEVDYRQMFAPLAKWVAEIDRADRIPEYVSRAFHVAQSGRPGPVVLALPEDMLSSIVEGTPAPKATLPSGRAAEADIAAILDLIERAERPFVIAGGPGWSADAAAALARFAEIAEVPVGVSFRAQDYLDNRHPNYAGDVGIGINPALTRRVREADVLLALGPRLGEMTTSGYTLLTPPDPLQKLIHVHPDPSEPGHVYRPTLSVAARADQVVRQLSERVRPPALSRRDQVADARASYEGWQEPPASPGPLKTEHVITHLSRSLPENAILTNGAGNYAAWLHRFFRYKMYRTQLAPTSGSMGYGLPAAIAAKLLAPERDVICLAGDGCFQMVAAEFGTACQYSANIVILVFNNGQYGTIRMHQERNYPGRVSGTQMVNPDFSAWARSYGAYGATVTENAAFPKALAEAMTAGRPAILDLKLSPLAISPSMTLPDAT